MGTKLTWPGPQATGLSPLDQPATQLPQNLAWGIHLIRPESQSGRGWNNSLARVCREAAPPRQPLHGFLPVSSCSSHAPHCCLCSRGEKVSKHSPILLFSPRLHLKEHWHLQGDNSKLIFPSVNPVAKCSHQWAKDANLDYHPLCKRSRALQFC